MTDTAKILHHIAELYAKPRKDQSFDDAVLELEEKLNNRFDAYDEAFSAELTSNIIKAVDDYWRFKSDKTRPTIAQVMAMVNSDDKKAGNEDPESLQGMRRRILKCADEVGDKYGAAARERYLKAARANWPEVDLSGHEWTEPEILECEKASAGDYAIRLMQRDIKLNRCRHLLPEYQAAVCYIAEDMLSREIPTGEWRKMSFAERCAAAMKRGLFNRFEEVLVLVCRQRQGKDRQFEATQETKPFNPNRAVQYLGAHYRVDDFSLAEGL